MTDAESPRDRAPGPGAGRDLPGEWFGGGPPDDEIEDFPAAPPPYPPPAPEPARGHGDGTAPMAATGPGDTAGPSGDGTYPIPGEAGPYRGDTVPDRQAAGAVDYWPVPPREPVEAVPGRGDGRKGRARSGPDVPVTSAGSARPLPVPSKGSRGFRSPWALPLVALVAAAALTAGVLAVDRLLTPPNPFLAGGTEFAATGANGATGTVRLVPTGTGTGVVLEPAGLPAAAAGGYYAAWLRGPDGTVVPLGSFHERRTGIPIFLWSAVEPAGYPEFVVTLQSENDQPAPDGPVVLTARLG